MTTQEIAERLVILCRQGQFETAQQELYGKDAVSLEPYDTPEFPRETKGLDAINKKIRHFTDMIQETHSLEVSEPLVATNSFSCIMHMDVTMKEKGRMNMKELCVYEIKDGKIISERFYM